MTWRTVTVTVEVTEHLTAECKIDEADYLDWLESGEDTDEKVREYLRAGDDSMTIAEVYDEAVRLGRREIWDSEIVRVRS